MLLISVLLKIITAPVLHVNQDTTLPMEFALLIVLLKVTVQPKTLLVNAPTVKLHTPFKVDFVLAQLFKDV